MQHANIKGNIASTALHNPQKKAEKPNQATLDPPNVGLPFDVQFIVQVLIGSGTPNTKELTPSRHSSDDPRFRLHHIRGQGVWIGYEFPTGVEWTWVPEAQVKHVRYRVPPEETPRDVA